MYSKVITKSVVQITWIFTQNNQTFVRKENEDLTLQHKTYFQIKKNNKKCISHIVFSSLLKIYIFILFFLNKKKHDVPSSFKIYFIQSLLKC